MEEDDYTMRTSSVRRKKKIFMDTQLSTPSPSLFFTSFVMRSRRWHVIVSGGDGETGEGRKWASVANRLMSHDFELSNFFWFIFQF